MASPSEEAIGPIPTFLGTILYHFTLIQPLLPTYLHLVFSALLPIYCGAHASLTRPSSAAKPARRKRVRRHDEESVKEESKIMEGLQPQDALLYPLVTGCVLAGLYFLIKWLDDAVLLNRLINGYLGLFGLFSVAKFIGDAWRVEESLVWPGRWSGRNGSVWVVREKERTVVEMVVDEDGSVEEGRVRGSPLLGMLGKLPLPGWMCNWLWGMRGLMSGALCTVEVHVRGVVTASAMPNLRDVVSFLAAVAVVLYFNLVDKPWYLTNLMGFSFSYAALQLMSPTTFWTGTLVLTSLFFYDIYFVFFTPMMITVAKSLDVPIKLLFPRPQGPDDKPGHRPMAMLGLGDVVLPGIMIGLALRFDLYLFYLKKQRRVAAHDILNGLANGSNAEAQEDDSKEMEKKQDFKLVKAPYQPATGNWGERFWLTGAARKDEGGSFPKVYFYSGIGGYIIGILCTLGVMHIFQHGQPALLYLVPAVLTAIWGTALVRGEVKTMWDYTEAEENEHIEKEKEKESEKEKPECDTSNASMTANGSVEKESASKQADKIPTEEKPTPERKTISNPANRNEAVVQHSKPESHLAAELAQKYSSDLFAVRIISIPTAYDEKSSRAKPSSTHDADKETIGAQKTNELRQHHHNHSSADSSPTEHSFLTSEGTPVAKRRRVD
jgi:minor histocompatibility antigen H13